MSTFKAPSLKRQTKRLVLRSLQKRDDRAWAAAHCAMLPTKGPWEYPRVPMTQITYPFYAKVLAEHQDEFAKDSKYTLGIFHAEVGTLLGFVFIENIERGKPTRATLDFRIFNIYWGKGFAKEAVTEAMKLKSVLKIDELQLAKKSAGKLKL